jgi:hypothetical protein
MQLAGGVKISDRWKKNAEPDKKIACTKIKRDAKIPLRSFTAAGFRVKNALKKRCWQALHGALI